jgi:uncharacterized protein with HEPN domain
MKDDALYLKHIFDAIETIQSYTSGVDRAQFHQNQMLRDAVVRELEIIGEAARNLSDVTRERAPDVEWSQIIGMRNRLIHAYFQVDIDLVWDIVAADLPALKEAVERLVSSSG